MSLLTPVGNGPQAAETPAALPVLAAEPGPAWAAAHRDRILAQVAGFGAVMLRGTGVATPADVHATAVALGIAPIEEREGFAPRTAHGSGAYSGSHWPADEQMCMHHERSYAAEVPRLILFGCLTAPRSGGRTAVADSQQVLRALPADLVAPFQRDGWLLTRAYHGEVGVGWAEAFGVADRASVDAYCAAAGLEHRWLPDGGLRTAQRRAAVIRHPHTGVPGWFNQIAFLNELTLDPVVRDYLVQLYGPAGLPFNTAYGDGSPIAAETVEQINEVYHALTVAEPWQDGDVLLVDNIRMAHSRESYVGEREVAVVFGDPVRPAGHLLDVPEGWR